MYRRHQSSTGGKIVTRRLQCLLKDAPDVTTQMVLPQDQLEPVRIESQQMMLERCSSPRSRNAGAHANKPITQGLDRHGTWATRRPVTRDDPSSTPQTAVDDDDETLPSLLAKESAIYSPRRGKERSVIERLLSKCAGGSELSVVVAMGHWSSMVESHEANAAVFRSLRMSPGVGPVYCLPISTGGRGWLKSFRAIFDADPALEQVERILRHPLNEGSSVLTAPILVAKQSCQAAVEGIQIIGAHLLAGGSPVDGSSYGLGQALRELAEMGVKTIYLGLGARSACFDCGCGLAQALGVSFFDAEGNLLPKTGNVLSRVVSVDVSTIDPVLSDVRVIIGYENSLPLLDASTLVAATLPEQDDREEWIQHVNNLTSIMGIACCNQTSASLEGSGAGGGVAYMLSVLVESDLRPGLAVVVDRGNLEAQIEHCDLFITGATEVLLASKEPPVELARLAYRHQKKTIVYTGSQSAPVLVQAPEIGIDCIVPLPQLTQSPSDDEIVYSLLDQVTRNVRLLQIGGEM